jgi:hypothetical protein
MSRQVVLAALLAAGLALLPVLYLHLIWPSVLAWVPTHYGPSGPDHFVGRAWLWNVVWLPALAFGVLTFWPQVQDGQSLFWSSYHQRRTRLVVVAGLALALTALVRTSAQASRSQLGPRAASHLACCPRSWYRRSGWLCAACFGRLAQSGS